jgi:hypothetical protein
VDPAPFKAYKGMAGVAKTSTIIGGELLRAITIPGYRGFIGRHNYNDLTQTGIPRFEEMVHRISPSLIVDRDKTPPARYWLQAPGATAISEIMFVGLKDYPGGYEWHHGSVDEADECDERIILGLKSRLRAPQPEGFEITYGIDLAFNPPDETHWLYSACTGKNHAGKPVPEKKWLKLFEPEVGENDENLPKDYFLLNFAGMPEDMMDRLRWGKWGASFPGQPVYPQFSSRLHVVDEYEPRPDRATFRFWDFGYRRPCCIWVQMDEEGRLHAFDEVLGENEEARPFIRRMLSRTRQRYPLLHGILDFGDPAATQKKDTGSTLSILHEEGVRLIFIRSTIEEGIRRTRFLLETLTKGAPHITLLRKRCPLTIRMFQGGYRMDEKFGQKPVKDGTYDHLADAFRYGIINLYNEHGRMLPLPDAQVQQDITDAIESRQALESIEYRPEADVSAERWDR